MTWVELSARPSFTRTLGEAYETSDAAQKIRDARAATKDLQDAGRASYLIEYKLPDSYTFERSCKWTYCGPGRKHKTSRIKDLTVELETDGGQGGSLVPPCTR